MQCRHIVIVSFMTCFQSALLVMCTATSNNNNKKYVLWNAGICPIAEIVRNTTFDDDVKMLGIIRCVVLAMAYSTKKKRSI